MIGHYLLTLCPEAEDAILTGTLRPMDYSFADGSRCLVGHAADVRWNCETADWTAARQRHFRSATYQGMCTVEPQYDALCHRFGTERINRVIRERILANQARRTLVPQEAACTS